MSVLNKNIFEALASRTIVCDGAMGTQLFAAGLAQGSSPELWNVEKPEAVKDVHKRYLDAGANVVTSNTFGGSEPALDRHGLAARMEELNVAAVKNARAVAGDDAFVFADLGPFGGFLEPFGDMTEEELTGVFQRQAKALVEAGADAVIVETMVDPNELSVAVKAAKSVTDKPVIATYAFNHDLGGGFKTIMGSSAEDAIKAAIAAGADVVGANCGTDLSLDDYRALAKALVAAAGPTPVILQPNAGKPTMQGTDLVYHATPEQMAELALDLKAIGVKVIGGCCGTNPTHIAAMAKALSAS